ncbi:MAG TPA: alcohol dehydrogenase catalytic domain-containing protein [Ochrobactrum intermedium]|uniref:alcohol dehydrogenase n=1 Tax=Brucella intermedia TaxID=94625 RepID=A0A7V6P9R7_9HYPH|nr:alcohol dehydrogenase catalytic domain-containing protein [Brucella intermedia]HHV67029.1 alcohol dehydrogenase catalytic domain-containing protein [Brucella intermedia]
MKDGTMRAAVLSAPGKPLEIANVDIPQPGPGQILIRLEASGVCHTDVHVWRGDVMPVVWPEPFILGHEGVGIVAAIGPDVEGWSTGDRAGAAWIHDTCGQCAECHDGEESFCQSHRAHGFNVPGTFAEYVVADARFAARLPASGKASALAPLMCAGLTAYGALRRAELVKGETCVIFGCGGLGLYAVQLATRAGARVIAVDTSDEKLATAAAFGAWRTLKASSKLANRWDVADQANVCINFAPTSATWDMMIAAIRPRGRIVAAAMVSQPVDLNQEWLTGNGVKITGTSVGTRAQMAELIALHQQDPFAADVTEIALEDVTRALENLDRGSAKGRYCVVL